MARENIGKVYGGKTGKAFPVGYDPSTKAVYILTSGMFGMWINIGKASSAQEAMRKADAHVWNQ